MKKFIIALGCLVLFSSHDMYLKLDTYFLPAQEEATLYLYNGTFEKSDNVIDRDRMVDASLVGNGERNRLEDSQWTERDSTTVLRFQTGEPGTKVVGVSTAPRTIEMSADDFNNYLEHDGVADMLQYRKENDLMANNAVEKYSKHVKAIFQVGDVQSDDWKVRLGYPIEFLPVSNPYQLHTGDTLTVQLFFNGAPLANQLVYANYKPGAHSHVHNGDTEPHSHGDDRTAGSTVESNEHGHSHSQENVAEDHSHNDAEGTHSHGHARGSEEPAHTHSHGDGPEHTHATEDRTGQGNREGAKSNMAHDHVSGQTLRTDANGMVDVHLEADGIWYLRTIHLAETEEDNLTHESNWATLTFESTHSHEDRAGAAHSHEHEEGTPSYFFWILSILVVAGLFFYFNRNKGKA